MTSVNNKQENPLSALTRLFGAASNEVGRAGNEGLALTTESIDSVGKGIETGGFLGGALQLLDAMSPGTAVANLADVATGPGRLDPKLKEGISAATNWAVGSPALFKDLFDLFTSPSTPGVPPAPANAVPPPNVEQLRGQTPQVPNQPNRSGYAEDVVGSTRSYEVNIVETRGAHQKLVELTGTMDQLRNDPEVAKRWPEVKYALDQKDWSLSAQSTVIIMKVLQESPETSAQVVDLGRQHGIEVKNPADLDAVANTAPSSTSSTSSTSTAPTAQTGQGDFSQAGDQLGQLAQGAMGMLGQAFSFIGPLLSNPAVQSALIPLLSTALTALTAATGIPFAMLIPALPVILPLIGSGLTMAGGMMTGQGGAGGAGASGGGGPDLGALLGAGPSGGGLGDLLGPISGLLGGAGSALPLPI